MLVSDLTQAHSELFNMLINPESHAFALRWHRDDVREKASEDEERQALSIWHYGVRLQYRSSPCRHSGYLLSQVQWNTYVSFLLPFSGADCHTVNFMRTHASTSSPDLTRRLAPRSSVPCRQRKILQRTPWTCPGRFK